MSEFCVNWISFKKSISEGFSRLQQNGEFVDMTLAAEGHLVQVHKNIVALASPYLKAMISSVTCQHPVIFLNKISHKILGFILEYIYTGEVKVPSDVLPMFVEACKELHLNGVDNLDLPRISPETVPDCAEPITRTTEPIDNNFAAHITINSENYNVEVVPIDNMIEQHRTVPIVDDEVTDTGLLSYPIVDNEENGEDILDEPINNVKLIETEQTQKTVRTILPNIRTTDKSQLYSISNRGSLQLLLNRYMYYCHHQSCEGRRRRWRCIDYRKMQCPAVIDTYDGDIVKRSEIHCHANHDTKILRKFKSKAVFTSLFQAEEKVIHKKRIPTRVYKKKLTSN